MVLYKRKPVTYVRPPPIPQDLATEIYVIPQTKEWFLTYEEYLARTDYYNRRKFVCEITGNSCLTYYEAYESEAKEIRDLEANFPEALREHILKYLQFNRISRIDLLVDKVYLVFKNEYFPGEEVYVKKLISPLPDKLAKDADPSLPLQPYMSSVKQRGVIREKVQYSNPSDTKYLVSTLHDNTQIIATNQQISRDRNHFTKWLVKTYVKLTVTRSPKIGAPWVVKERYATKYRIPTEFPDDLKQFEHLTPSGEIAYEGDDKPDSPSPSVDAGAAPKVKKPRGRAALKIKAALKAAQEAELNGGVPPEGTAAAETTPLPKTREKNDAKLRFPVHHLPLLIRELLELKDQATSSLLQPSKKTIVDDLRLTFDLQNTRPAPSLMKLPENARQLNSQVAEQLEEELTELQEVASDEDTSERIAELEKEIRLLKSDSLQSVQEALECWTFLNIYHQILKLDTFTFDDFVCAMGWNDEQLKHIGRCELLDEIWCAVLGLIVSNDATGGKNASDETKIAGIQITLPPNVALLEQKVPAKNASQEDDDEVTKGSDSEHEIRPLKIDDENSDNESVSPAPRKHKKRETSDTLEVDADDEGEHETNGDKNTESGVDDAEEYEHNAYSVMNYRGVKWHEKLRKRNFKDGNWLTIVMGVLSLVEYVPEFSETIQKVYVTLAPALITPATLTTVTAQFYSSMGIDLRLKVLHILTSLVVNGNAVRAYMDESLDASANLRRTRLDILRDWKLHVDTANKLHSEVFSRLMEEVGKASDTKLWSLFLRKKHRLNKKGYEMTEYEKAVAEADPSFQELWDAREAEIAKIREARSSKKEVEMQLSQLDCQRVRLLGKDRHFNRYWWFENNGLPNIHYSGGGEDEEEQQEPESDDDADEKDDFQTETYLMGCLWIQGPSGMDSASHLKLSKEEADEIVRSLETEDKKENIKLEPKEEKEEKDEKGETEETEEMGETEQRVEENGGLASAQTLPENANGSSSSLREMDFTSLKDVVVAEAQKKGVIFKPHSIEINGSIEVIDKHGGIPKDFDVDTLMPVQRKFIEEQNVPLFSNQQWRYFDQAEDVDSLIKWLNPWGKRESLLRKEFLRVREGMTASIAARRKALWLDKLPKEEAELEETLEAVDAKIEKLKNGEAQEAEAEESDEDVVLTTRKRPNRRVASGPNKRQKTNSEVISSGSLEDVEQLRAQLQDSLAQKVAENQITRVTEWVNRTARDEFDKSLYEGGDKAKTRGRKGKK